MRKLIENSRKAVARGALCMMGMVILWSSPFSRSFVNAQDEATKDRLIAGLEIYSDVSSTAPQIHPSSTFVNGKNSTILYDEELMWVMYWAHDKLLPSPQYADNRPVDVFYRFGNEIYLQALKTDYTKDEAPFGLTWHWNEVMNCWQMDCRYNWLEDQAARELVKDIMKKTLGENAWKTWYIRTLNHIHTRTGYFREDEWTYQEDGVQGKFISYPDHYSFLYRAK